MRDEQYDARRPISAWLIFSMCCPVLGFGAGVAAYFLVIAWYERVPAGDFAYDWAKLIAARVAGLAAICLFTAFGLTSLWIGARRSKGRQDWIAFSLLTNLGFLVLIGVVIGILRP
jgi:magnesium-transporting ATPase (P-type)